MNDYATKFLDKIVKVKIDRPLGSKHPKHSIYYSVNYGYVPGEMAPDGEELDAYVLGIFEPVKEFVGRCIAVVYRLNDDDDKLIVVPDGISYTKDQISSLVEFQERFFESIIIK
ncbi:inorganic pyrophosphatase [Candidatus Falkowbacteria bacterium HGW-Falkowbacteria-1]|uniref:inorganic diphosphatase n=1 Tax=Candidatus Falkowbacteria bacterium HGW-Falkowbacteria-1 TaxID=2013768 RepID=A0A2N2EAM2_9BACT|nr:MAG: inorganic pyrophosphatase [Candidatus Falkowbacteria bacterium HGW-Falkowbacteria-1]